MAQNNFNEENDCGRIVSTDVRKVGNCSLTVCTLQNGHRINLFMDGKGGFRIWTLLCSNFYAGMWPNVIQLAEVLSPTGINLEITSELDLCCFAVGKCDMGSRDSSFLKAALWKFVDAITSNEKCIMCLHKKDDKGAI